MLGEAGNEVLKQKTQRDRYVRTPARVPRLTVSNPGCVYFTPPVTAAPARFLHELPA